MTIKLTGVTADELLAMGDIGPCELIDGEVVMMSPTGYEHCDIAAQMTAALVPFVRQHKLGRVIVGEPGFKIRSEPDTVRAPDVAFISAQRLPTQRERGFLEGAPDLAVEIVSPSDRRGDVAAKVSMWLDAGCRLVWVVDPMDKTVTVYRRGRPAQELTIDDILGGDEVLPGFAMPVQDIFAGM